MSFKIMQKCDSYGLDVLQKDLEDKASKQSYPDEK
jgi:hypothetical protein